MFKYILCFMFIAYSGLALAEEEYEEGFVFPDYYDDEAYEHCTKMTQDHDNCAKEESQRVLQGVKLFYKNILADQRLTNWNGSFEANKNMMRDMYESWTAFRNRICSLNAVASKYIGPLIEPKISCILFMNFNHHDYLNQILHTLNINTPKNPYPAKLSNVDGGNVYLQVDHDKSYQTCIKDKNNNDPSEECLKEEMDRSTKQIKDTMASLLISPTIAKWNNGPDIKNGNYRDMFDSWIAFRNRMCSLTTFAQKYAYAEKAVSFNTCIQFYNESFSYLLSSYLFNSYSVLDEEIIPEKEEAGEEEGKKIKPLTRHIETDTQETKDIEKTDENVETPKETATLNNSATNNKRGKVLPSWAKNY